MDAASASFKPLSGIHFVLTIRDALKKRDTVEFQTPFGNSLRSDEDAGYIRKSLIKFQTPFGNSLRSDPGGYCCRAQRFSVSNPFREFTSF